MENNAFVFLRSYFNAINCIKKPTLRLKAYEMIIEYGLNGVEPTITDETLLMAFQLIKPLFAKDKRSITSIINGQKSSGAPKGNQNARKNNLKNNLKTTQNNPPFKEREMETEKETEIEKEKEIEIEREKEIKRDISLDEYKKFKSMYPNKFISNKQKVFNDFNLNDLIGAINKSDFLKNNDNLSFKWFVKNYAEVLAGKWSNYNKNAKSSNMWGNMAEVFNDE